MQTVFFIFYNIFLLVCGLSIMTLWFKMFQKSLKWGLSGILSIPILVFMFKYQNEVKSLNIIILISLILSIVSWYGFLNIS